MAYKIPDCLPIAGGTMNGAIEMNSFAIHDLLDPVNPQDAATMAYVISHGGSSYLPLAGGTMTGTLQTVSNLQFNPLTVTTGTLTQSGTLVTFSSLPVISAYDGAFVVPATGNSYYVYYTGSSTTMRSSRFQNVASPTTYTLYYFNNTGYISQPSTFAITQTLFPNFQRIAIGSGSGAYLSVWNHFGSQAFGNGIAIGSGSTSLTTTGNPTASQSGTTVTASASVFTAASRGRLIRFAEGSTAFIRSVNSGTQVTVDVSQTISPGQQFFIVGSGSSEGISAGANGDFGTNNLYIYNTLNLPNGTFSIGGNTVFSGAFTFSGTLTADTNVTFPTTGLLLSTSKITNTIYVDANVGNDTTGTGSVLAPYATVTKAQSVITTASATNNYAIYLQGKTTESVTLKPWISIVGNGYLTCGITGNLSLDSSWGTATQPRINISNMSITGNISFSISGAGTSPNLILSNCFVSGTSTFTGRSGSDFYQIYNSELVGNVTATDCLFQSYSNIYDGTVLYRNSSAPGSSFWQSSGDLFNGAFNVTAGTAQSITAFVNSSRVSGGSTITGATANITYDATSYATGGITLVSSGTATPNLIPLRAGGTNANLTSANGAVAYSTSSALALSAVGSSGQLFRSTGAGAPGWTTATYPSTATSTGTILRADGTNWSATTATYPNTFAINDIPYANSANVLGVVTAAANSVLAYNGSSVPAATQTLPSAVQNNITAVNSAGNTLSIGGFTKTFTGAAANIAASGNVTSWTPGVAFGGGTTGITYSFQAGWYDAVTMPNGNVKVTAWGAIGLSNKGSSTGNLTITGFPVSTGSNASGYTAGMKQENITTAAGAQLWMTMTTSATTAFVQYMSSGSAINNVTNTHMANNSVLIFNIIYWTN